MRGLYVAVRGPNGLCQVARGLTETGRGLSQAVRGPSQAEREVSARRVRRAGTGVYLTALHCTALHSARRRGRGMQRGRGARRVQEGVGAGPSGYEGRGKDRREAAGMGGRGDRGTVILPSLVRAAGCPRWNP